MSVNSLSKFCSATGSQHSVTSTFCSNCMNRSNPDSVIDLTATSVCLPRFWASQDHLNVANIRHQQHKEQQSSRQQNITHAGSSALSLRTSADVARLKSFRIGVSLWTNTWSYANRDLKIKSSGKAEFIGMFAKSYLVIQNTDRSRN
jgi:hypothetical protein